MELRATIFSTLLAALLFAPTPSEAFSVPLQSSPAAAAPAQSAWVAPSRFPSSHTALGLFQRTAHDKEDAAAAAKDSSLFRRRRRRSTTLTMRPAAPLTRQTLTVTTTSLAIGMWRRARRLVTSLAFCFCLLLNWHAVAPGGTNNNVAHAAKAPEQEVVVGVDTTTTTTTLQQANRRSGRTIAVCAGVVLANELYKRSQFGNGNGDSSSSLLSAPNERSDNVDQVLTRPAKALEEIKQPTAAMAAPLTPSTNITTTAEATVAMTNSSDASLAATTTAATTNTNMTNIQKLQQRVETAANRMEDKLHEWSTQTRAFQDDDAADPRKATISLKRTTAGTVTSSSTGEELAARAKSVKSPTGQVWTKPPTPRIVTQAPVKLSPSPPAAAAAVKPYAVPVTSAPPPPPAAMSQVIRSPAAAAAATATPVVKASETSTSLSAQPAQMTGVPISTPPPPPPTTVPASDMTDIAPPVTAVGHDGGMTTGTASDAVEATSLSVMGFGDRGNATEMAEQLIISEPRDTTAPRSSNPKYDALRPIGFGNTTLGTQAKIAATAPVAIVKSMVQLKSPPSPTSGTHIANTTAVMAAPTIEPAMTPAARDTTPEPIRSSGLAAEEDALQQKYAAIEDVGERAYQILIDLGMI